MEESNFSHALNSIENLNLNAVINRLVHIEHWRLTHAINACQQYKKFLILKKKYQHQCTLPPSYEIDEVWHAHILHTASYINFCQNVFGEYLHHHPHHGDGSITEKELAQLFENETQKLYYENFGEYIYAIRKKPFMNRAITFIKKLFRYPKSLDFSYVQIGIKHHE